jgi:hypothetical protein
METTPGDYVDQNYVLRAVLAGHGDFDVQGSGLTLERPEVGGRPGA